MDDDCCNLCESNNKLNEDYETSEASEECPLTQNQRSKKCRYKKCIWKFRIAGYILAILTIITIIYLIYLSSNLLKSSSRINKNIDDNKLSHGAVAADNEVCSKMGIKIIQEGGNAVDAAIASMICMCIVAPDKTGFGGGGIAIIHSQIKNNNESDPLVIDFATNTISGAFELAKIRIPSVLRGLDYLHSLRGKLSWDKIIRPGAILAKKGFNVSSNFAKSSSKKSEHSATGDFFKMEKLGETLDSIAQHRSNILYNGTLSKKLLHDIHCSSNLFHQLAAYQPKIISSKKIKFYDYTIFSPVHSTIFQSTLEDTNKLKSNKNEYDTMAKIAVNLIDNFNYENTNSCIEKEKYTTVVAADSDGNFVSIVTGISVPLGLGHMCSAGFLLDTAKTSNSLKRLTPIIFIKEKTTTGVLGVDDPVLGTEILSNLIIEKLNLSSAIERQRYYRTSQGIKLEPQTTHQQLNFPNNLKTLIESFQSSTVDKNIFKSVNGIIKENNSLTSHSDSRGGGIAYRFK